MTTGETPEFDDLIVCMISSVVPDTLHALHVLLNPDRHNNLKTMSIIKIYRIATMETKMIITATGKLTAEKHVEFAQKFKSFIN